MVELDDFFHDVREFRAGVLDPARRTPGYVYARLSQMLTHHPGLKEWVRDFKVAHTPSGEVAERHLSRVLDALRAWVDESTAVSTTAWDAGVVYNPDKRPSTLARELKKAAKLLRRHQRVRTDAMVETFVSKLPNKFPAMIKAVHKYYEDHGSTRIRLHRIAKVADRVWKEQRRLTAWSFLSETIYTW